MVRCTFSASLVKRDHAVSDSTKMKYILTFVLSLLVVSCTTQGMSIQAYTADSVAAAANASLPVLIEEYRQEGYRAIDKAETEHDARMSTANIMDQWRPVWAAWRTLKDTQEAYATVIENGGDVIPAINKLRTAYCSFMDIWPASIPIKPIATITCSDSSAIDLATELNQ